MELRGARETGLPGTWVTQKPNEGSVSRWSESTGVPRIPRGPIKKRTKNWQLDLARWRLLVALGQGTFRNRFPKLNGVGQEKIGGEMMKGSMTTILRRLL